MIAVARMIRTSDPVESDELKDQEREQLRRVDPLREIDLAADLLLDALKDPQRALNDPIVPVRRMALRATGDLLATDAILPPKNPKLIKKWLKVQKAKKVQEEQEKEQPKQAAVEQAAAAQQCGVCCEKEKEPAKPTPTPKPDEKPEPDPPSVVVGPDKLVILEPVHFALAKYDILPKSSKILKDVGTALKNHPEIKKVRVEGHTDVRHNDAYNQTLSENRVNSVVNWLVDKEGIDGDRLVGQGFGESRLLIKDAKTEAEHFKNRRVEFVITDGVVQPKPKAEELPPPVEQAPDAATSVPEAKGPQTEGPCGAAEPPKVEPTPPKVDPVPPDVEPEKKKDPIPVQPDKLVVPEVLFDFNKDTLTKQSVEILKGVVETLKNHPEIKHVDVEGHTDSRGLDAYNLDLSQRRMNRVVDFLVKAGIDGKRLSGVGKGETELKIKNAKTPDEHHQNRRVEFKITDGPGIPSENAETPSGPQGGQFEPGEPQVEPEQGPKSEGPKTEGPKTEGPKTEGPKTQGPKNLGGGPGPTPLIKATAGPAVQTPPPKKTEEEKGAKAPKTEEAAEEEAETESQEAEAKEQTDQAADDAKTPEAPSEPEEGPAEGKDGGPAPSEAPLPAPTPPEAPKEPQKPKKLEAKTPAELSEQFAKASPTQKALSYGTLGKQMDVLSRDEQKQTQQGMPEFHATLKDQSPLPAGKGKVGPDTKADATPTLAPADVSTGQKGQLPKPNVNPPPKLGPFVPRPVTIPGAGGGTERVVVQAKGEAGGALPESSGGEALAPEVRAPMEQSFQADFSGVRVHTDGAGGATAFARGEHIHFAPGRYDPDTVQGREVLGHELAHVQQQRAGRVRVPQGLDLPINDDPALESEADVAGAKAARGERADVSGSAVGAPGGAIQGKGVVGNPLAQVQQVIRQVQTVDPGVKATKLGPAPKPTLKGDANPALADAAAASGLTQAEAAKKAAQQKLLASPGAELVQPVRMDETHRVGELKAHKLEAPPEIPAVKQYVDLGLPGDVQAKFDDMYSAEMEKRLDGPRAKVRKATDDRDAKKDQALADADKKSAKLHEQSQKQQNQVIEEQRQRIHKERQVTLQAQEKALQDVRAQVAKERANVKGRISQRAKEDERRIDAAYADAQKRSDAQVASAEKQAAGLRRDAAQQVAKVEGRSAGRPVQGWKFLSSLVSGAKDLWKKGTELVKSTLAEVGKAVTRALNAARAAVAAIMEGVKKLATNIIALGAKFIVGLIAGFGKLVKGLITNTIGKVFPGLAKKLNQIVDAAVDLAKKSVNKVADLLKKGVAALCDGVVKIFNTILSVFNGLVQAALALTQFMLTGSFGDFGLKVLEAVLAMAGIDPAEFKAVFGKGDATVKTIIKNPRAFVSNATKAASQGFEKFSNNFPDHLQKGLVGWLTGQLGDVKVPEKLDAAGVFDIVLQVLGVGPDQLKKKAAKVIGERNVERVLWVVDFIKDMMKDSEVASSGSGLAGLWAHVEKDVGNLWDEVIGGIKSWLLTRVVSRAVLWIASMFNPVGAILQLVMTAWNLYTWFKTNASRIWGVVTVWIGSMAEIVAGKVEPAAKKIEQVLAGLLPIAISLLANLVGLNGVAQQVRKLIEKVQLKIDRAIDKVINKALGLFKGKGDKKQDQKGTEDGGGAFKGELPEGEIGKLVVGKAKTYKLADLKVAAKYELEVANRSLARQRFKKSGQKGYDATAIDKSVQNYLKVVLHKDLGASDAEALFAVIGSEAFKVYGRKAEKYLEGKLKPAGLRVTKVILTGVAPQGKTAEQVGTKLKEKGSELKNRLLGRKGKKDQLGAKVYAVGWEDPKVKEKFLEKKKFGGVLETESLWIDAKPTHLWIALSSPKAKASAQMMLWMSKLSELDDTGREKVREAMGKARQALAKWGALEKKLRWLREDDDKRKAERLKTADEMLSIVGELVSPFSIAYRAFNGYGVESRARSKSEDKRDRERQGLERRKARKDAAIADAKKLWELTKEHTVGKKPEEGAKTEKKIKAHGWEFPEAESVLAKAGSVVVLGPKVPVTVEPVEYKLEVKLEGLGTLPGLAALWDMSSPGATFLEIQEYRAARAALASRITLFRAAASLLDPMLGETADDETKRSLAAVAVVQAALAAAQAAAAVAKVVGLPPGVAGSFQAALKVDAGVGGTQAGWAFEDVKGVVEKKRVVSIGYVPEPVAAKASEGELKLQVGKLGKAEALRESWLRQADPKRPLAGALEPLDAALKKHAEEAAKLGASVGLDSEGATARQTQANTWAAHVDKTVLPELSKAGGLLGRPDESSRQAKASWKPIEVDLPRQKETMLIAHADGEKLALHVGALGTTHALARQYRARLEAEQLANPLARSVKGLKAALGTLVEANEAFDKATAAFQGSIGATEEEWETLRLDVSRKGEAVGKALEAVWASYGPPGAKGEDPWGNLLLRVPFKVGGGNIPAPPLGVERDTKANPTKGWEFPEAKKFLGPLEVTVDGVTEALAVDEEKDPPVLNLGKKTVADHLDEVLARAVSGAASANWRDARAAEGRFNAAMAQLGKYTDNDKYHEALRTEKATAVGAHMAAVKKALEALDPVLAPEKKAAPVKQTPAPPPAK